MLLKQEDLADLSTFVYEGYSMYYLFIFGFCLLQSHHNCPSVQFLYIKWTVDKVAIGCFILNSLSTSTQIRFFFISQNGTRFCGTFVVPACNEYHGYVNLDRRKY